MTSRVRLTIGTCFGVLGLAGAVFVGLPQVIQATSGATDSVVVPAPTVDEPTAGATAVLAGGCFWGVQGVFQHVKGVTEAESGYAGGSKDTADYETVSTGTTGHAESVRITYDPTQVTFGQLLRIYFSVVTDPTQLNRQGPDTGTQYRSAIFAQDATQQRVAQAYIVQLNQAKAFAGPIVTKVEPNTGFFPAEGYHQNYLNSNPTSSYIAINDMPKVDALKELFPSEYRDQPVLVPNAG
ncbi:MULTISPECIES: peptide-methionine (S)-S-oxide reductase MsrA [unclassified Mycobacterium]|uniref:peptide-methionine (S)-S-oxide reductase MsrA n=1 Tax=unclassified Mycobacterium TaxID=2642494 RepID=UPI0029C94883|nr:MULTISPECIES: peptide-methionine (S)-S-oxide reductase MsrA [unclassified Mycobacterium]